MIVGFFKTDFEGDVYLIPESEIESFNNCCDVIDSVAPYEHAWYDYVEHLNTTFSKYRVEDITKYKVIIDEN